MKWWPIVRSLQNFLPVSSHQGVFRDSPIRARPITVGKFRKSKATTRLPIDFRRYATALLPAKGSQLSENQSLKLLYDPGRSLLSSPCIEYFRETGWRVQASLEMLPEKTACLRCTVFGPALPLALKGLHFKCSLSESILEELMDNDSQFLLKTSYSCTNMQVPRRRTDKTVSGHFSPV